jgi:hypothetical protein
MWFMGPFIGRDLLINSSFARPNFIDYQRNISLAFVAVTDAKRRGNVLLAYLRGWVAFAWQQGGEKY